VFTPRVRLKCFDYSVSNSCHIVNPTKDVELYLYLWHRAEFVGSFRLGCRAC